jgi:hypothetical protein
MIARETSRMLCILEPWRRTFPDVRVLRDGAAIRISCEGRQIRIVLPADALTWSLDDFAAHVLLQPLMNLTNYDPPLGG